MTLIKFNETFDLEVLVKEKDKCLLERILRENNYNHRWDKSVMNDKLCYFTIYNVGIRHCEIIRQLIKHVEIQTY